MAKTIKEMAVEYSKKYRHIICRCTGRKSYEVGAMDVLKEIQSCCDWKCENGRLIVPAELVIHRIEDKIKELKGDKE